MNDIYLSEKGQHSAACPLQVPAAVSPLEHTDKSASKNQKLEEFRSRLQSVATELGVDLAELPEWMRALFDRAATCDEGERGISFLTPWGGIDSNKVNSNPELHAAFIKAFCESLAREAPELLPIFSLAGTVVAIAPGFAGFAFGDPQTPYQQFRMPQLEPLTVRAWHLPTPTIH